MITITDSELADLKVELNTAEIVNDVQVLLPSYTYTLELKDDGWHKYPVDLVARATDGQSINKYGRRSKIQNKHVIEAAFADAYCAGEIEKYKEPTGLVSANLIGHNDANIIRALTARAGQGVIYQDEVAGLDNTGRIDSVTFDVELGGIPRLALEISQVRALDLLDWFVIGTDVLNGSHVIG